VVGLDSRSPTDAVSPLTEIVVSGIVYDPLRRRPRPDPMPVYRDSIAEAECLVSVCQEYFQHLNLANFFRPGQDYYCAEHYPNYKVKQHKRGGHYYTMPCGWVRFRIEIDEVHIREKKIFQSWAVSYYGTCEENLWQILRTRFIPLSGTNLVMAQFFQIILGANHNG
jgi:hypothetical protein